MVAGRWLVHRRLLARALVSETTEGRKARPRLDGSIAKRTAASEGRDLNLPFTRRMLGVDLVGSRRIWPAQVGCLVDLVGSRPIQKDRLDDHSDDQGHPTEDRMARRATLVVGYRASA
jgi:hypothetical protein